MGSLWDGDCSTHKLMTTANRWKSALLTVLITTNIAAVAEQKILYLDPAKTAVNFTLDAALHTVHGTFRIKQSALQFDPASSLVSGEILVDAKSGETGNGMRDRKMHKEVLESDTYPEISFRPDRVEGSVANAGKSSVRVHGIFRIHGIDREITVPAEVEMSAGQWAATVHFTVPYARWGMRNPSTLFLHVSDSVEIDLVATGSISQSTASRDFGTHGIGNHGPAQ
jgi:polyisoprenoid-binding protein YceI